MPTLIIVWFVCRIRSSKFIIDWHNYGYTILALSLGEKHLLVRLYSRLEFNFGKRSDYNFCVTRSMKDDLRKRIGKKYDYSNSVLFNSILLIFFLLSIIELSFYMIDHIHSFNH